MSANRSPDDTPAMFAGVGAVVVAGGHVEWELRRLLLWVRGKGPHHLPEVTRHLWSTLVQKIRAEAGQSTNATDVLAVLDWADQADLMKLRNMVVHAYWWVTPGQGIRANRHEKGGSGYILSGTPADLTQIADKLFTFAQRLREASSPDDRWPEAFLGGDDH